MGVGATNALGKLRLMLDPNAASPNPPQDLLNVSAAYGTYMAVSSNLRYQVRRLPHTCRPCRMPA